MPLSINNLSVYRYQFDVILPNGLSSPIIAMEEEEEEGTSANSQIYNLKGLCRNAKSKIQTVD